MSTSKLMDAFIKIFDNDYFNNMEEVQAGLEAVCKSITDMDCYKQIHMWKKVLNDPESSVYKSMLTWWEFSKKIDYERMTGIQTGLQQLTFYMPQIDMSVFEGLQTNLEKLLNTENLINVKLSEAIEYAYETASEVAGKPDISKEELQNVVREEIETDTIGDAVIENSKFKQRFYTIIKFILINVIVPLVLNFIYDLGKAQIGKLIKSSSDNDAPVIYEIHNDNTYVNIIDQTDKKYRVLFIDDGNLIDGYTDKENINMKIGDEEHEK